MSGYIFVLTRATFGGVQFELLSLLRRFSKFHSGCVLIVGRSGPLLQDYRDIEGLEVICLSELSSGSLTSLFEFWKFCIKYRAYRWFIFSVEYRFKSALLLKRKNTVYRHSGMIFNNRMPVLSLIINFLVEFINVYTSSQVVTVSPSNECKLRRWFNFHKRICTIPTYYDGNRFIGLDKDASREFIIKKLGLSSPTRIIVCPLSFVRHKNQDWLYTILLGLEDFNIALLFCGDGELRQEMQDRLRSKLKLKVYFLGNVSNIETYISGADIVASASTYMEGLPQIISQSYYCRTPFFGWDWEGNRDEVFSGINGELFRVGDTISFQQGVVECLTGDRKYHFPDDIILDHGERALDRMYECLLLT
jgi:glycosyltransferase involved in cell wall biosynthesis